EILANDVRCTHAAAIAQLDPKQLFYLRSRGLPENAAKRLMIEGFLTATVSRFEEGPFRDLVAGAIDRRVDLVLG
ncbi:MAG: SufD family Fe-S cluster assembly protein, partial [Solirubrobacteraceae bacterium]|nr:SufD family Fe-S cluster assembly protein [Solirubrobacteraceae bacterium]